MLAVHIQTGSKDAQGHEMHLTLPQKAGWISDRHRLPSGGDDSPTLSRLPLRSHRVLGLPLTVWFPFGRIRGRPPPPPPARWSPIFTPQNQGGAERGRSQEESQESRVGASQTAFDPPPSRPPHDGTFWGKERFEVSPD